MRWLWPTLTAAIVADALNRRRRIEQLDVLEPSDEPVDPTHRFVTATDVVVDEATARAASAHARRHGLDVVDLVPADLPTERLLTLARLVDPATYRGNPLAKGYGAHHALLVTEDVAERARVESFTGLAPGEMAEVTGRLKRYATRSTDLVLAPSLPARPDRAGVPVAEMEVALTGPFVAAGLLADVALFAGAARSRRPWALAAAAARVAQPLLATSGTRMRPRDMPGAVPRQVISSAQGLTRALSRRGGGRRRGDEMAQARKDYDELLAGGIERFFEPRRPDCPFCGSGGLRVRVVLQDLVQCKPGTFTLEECEACGHVFQNPRLTPEGLDFYYRDYYDGTSEDLVDAAFNRLYDFYSARAEMVRDAAPAPQRWLDVGGGHGHFCLTAKSTFPDTTFDALDMNESIEEAERRGWTGRSYRGMFPDLAPQMPGRYDVVSMFHYLEHAREPTAELDAAATVLAPGGLLLVEVPDASSHLARALGRFWFPWTPPQHLHFPSVENLTALLEARGFTTVAVQRGEAHVPIDFAGAAGEFVNWLQPRLNVPWRPRPTPADRAKRVAAIVAGSPLMVAGIVADQAIKPLGGRIGTSNSYRLLARRTPTPT